MWLKPPTYELNSYFGAPIYHTCPSCTQTKTYRRYIVRNTEQQIADYVGRCTCGYHHEPTASKLEPSFIPESTRQRSLRNYEDNRFFSYLTAKFPEHVVLEAMQLYSVGTAHMDRIVLWLIDKDQNTRTGAIFTFTRHPGECPPFSDVKFAHQLLNIPDFDYAPCIYGEHLLLKYPKKEVVLVDLETTAIEASCKYPDYVWLCSDDCQSNALFGRKVHKEDRHWSPSIF